MNVKTFENCSLNGKSLSLNFSLDFSLVDYVLKSQYSLSKDQYSTSVPIAAETKNGYLVIVEDDGHLNFFNLQTMYRVYRFKAHDNSIFDTKFRPNYNKHVLTASGDKSMIIWDLEEQKKILKIESGHNCSIRSIDFHDDNVFVSGGRDGYIRLWDLRSDKKLIQSIKDAHRNSLKSAKKQNKRCNKELSDPNSVVTSVCFSQDNYLFSSGANDGCIKIWDIRQIKSNSSNHLIYLDKLKYCGSNEKAEGFTSLVLDSKRKLYAACTDNKIYSYDYRGNLGLKPESDFIKCFKGASITNYTRIRILNDDLLIAGSSNAEVCIWSLQDSKKNFYNYPSVKLPHGTEDVSVIACDDSNYEIYSCDDTTTMYKWVVNSKLNQKYNKNQVSILCDKMKDEKVDLNKHRKVLSPRNTILNLQNLTSGVKRPYSMMKSR